MKRPARGFRKIHIPRLPTHRFECAFCGGGGDAIWLAEHRHDKDFPCIHGIVGKCLDCELIKEDSCPF